MNNQQISKIINFYRINHDFQPPYTFLVDGNFLKILVQKQISLQEFLSSAVPGKMRVKITSCIISELELLGPDFRIVHQKSLQMQQLRCKHAYQSADRCIKDHVSDFNIEKLIICSQDQILRRKIRRFQVPIVYFGGDQRITMQDVERHTLKKVEEETKAKLLPQQNEMKELEDYKLQEQIFKKEQKKREQRKFSSIRGVELQNIKKKFTKGPNPNSVKKKKIKFNEEKQPQNISRGQQQQVPKKKRIRKRKNKNKNVQQQ